MMSISKFIAILVIAMSSMSANAFVNKIPSQNVALGSSTVQTSPTTLSGRRWNFNEGQSPWGLKTNAETWNGRVAQVAFVWVFIQELITGKGIFKGLDEGDLFFQANAGLFAICVVGLTGWLAIQGDDDFTTSES